MDVEIEQKGDVTIATLAGDLDLADMAEVRSRLHEAVAGALPPPIIVIDMTGVTFIDSTGLSSLLSARKAMGERGGQMRLVVSSTRILKLFRITSLHKVFEIYPSMQDALNRSARVTSVTSRAD